MDIVSSTKLLTLHMDIWNSHLSLVLSCSSRQNKSHCVCVWGKWTQANVCKSWQQWAVDIPSNDGMSAQNLHCQSVFTSLNKVLRICWIQMEHLPFWQPHSVVNLWPQPTQDFLTLSHMSYSHYIWHWNQESVWDFKDFVTARDFLLHACLHH